jgi:CPA1 family monovalent cation:H+ antiporter
VIAGLRLDQVPDDADDEEVTARYLGALAAVERLDNLTALGASAADRLGRVRATYDDRVAYYSRRLTPREPDGDGAGNGAADPASLACETGEQIEREALSAERQMIVRLRDQGVIGDEVLRRIQEELDHEESRLEG